MSKDDKKVDINTSKAEKSGIKENDLILSKEESEKFIDNLLNKKPRNKAFSKAMECFKKNIDKS